MAEQSVPPLDGLRAELELMESVGWPGTSHEYRRGVQYAISRLSRLVPQPSERSEPARQAWDDYAPDVEEAAWMNAPMGPRELERIRNGPAAQPSASGDMGLREALDAYDAVKANRPDQVDLTIAAIAVVAAVRAALASQPSSSEPDR